MKIAIMGDIHGNAYALDAVLTKVNSLNIDTLLITGDLVGYYYMINDVLELLEPWQKYIVRGNHEDMLNNARKDSSILPEINRKYGGAINDALNNLEENQLDMLCSLKHPLDLEIDEIKILLCHGSPWNNNQYVYPDADQTLIKKCAMKAYDIVIMGHTHYPLLKNVGSVQLVNPGSVGQPRNRIPKAHWAMLDTQTKQITQYAEEYDAAPLIADIKSRHPELPYLAEVLTRS